MIRPSRRVVMAAGLAIVALAIFGCGRKGPIVAPERRLPMPPGDRRELQDALWHRFRIEVPVFEWNGLRLLRVSTHLYNTPEDVDRLAAALRELL